ncbi:MAG: DEAD/DEAH box helicase [Phycisphaera sp.]|nr:MAG: DEAD/DEAH box helicase [Phycisphaera sp.]
MELRPYQREAIDAAYAFLTDRDGNPCVVIPTGGGKTPVIATICRDVAEGWSGRVLILAHQKELLGQAADKLHEVSPGLPMGIYSAGLKQRELGAPVTIAGIQSVHGRACELVAEGGPIDLVLIDEAHMVPHADEGMYRRFLNDLKTNCPHARVVGLTATPYRLKGGPLCGDGHVLSDVCYEIGVAELIRDGYLSPLRTRAGATRADVSSLHVRGGEFIAGETEAMMDEASLVDGACAEIADQTRDRAATLIFASGVRHGRHVARVLAERHGIECGFVCSKTPPAERDELIGRFRSGDLRYLANVNMLTTGFDAPHVDCVALLRPTMSCGLYYQMVGRGFRLSPGKADCLVLDFAGNVLRHGPVDALSAKRPGQSGGPPPAKECPACNELVATGCRECPECGHAFPEPERTQHGIEASDAGILTGQASEHEHEVQSVSYRVHHSRRKPDAPPTMRVDYHVSLTETVSEWIAIGHGGYARSKAVDWWLLRSHEPAPGDAEGAVELANAGALAEPSRITVRRVAGEKFDRIVASELGPKPARLDDPDVAPELVLAIPDDEIPF